MKNYVLQGTISASVLSFNSNLINHYANHTGLKAELPISDGGSNWGTASVHGPLCKRKRERPEKYKIYLSWGGFGPHSRNGFQQLVLPYHRIFNRKDRDVTPHLPPPQTRWSHPSGEAEFTLHQPGRSWAAAVCRLPPNSSAIKGEGSGTVMGDSPLPREVSEVGGVTHPWGGPIHRCSQDPRS